MSYQAVDSSTLRVFSIGTVGLKTLASEDGRREISVATPIAGHGTGFMVGSSGLLLTAQHVVDGARHVVVRLPGDGGFTPARVVHANKEEDIAVLSIERPIPAIQLGNVGDALQVRQTVFTIGYPLDPSRSRAQSAKGIVAGELADGTLQLDIAVNPGNSGGPLVDEGNRVVGMVVARGDVKGGVQGMGFAVPLSKLITALSIARETIALSGIVTLREEERRSAAVVDELIQRGALHLLADSNDLNSQINRDQLVQDLRAFTATIDDPDLLTFVSGNLWNAHLIIKYGGLDEIGGTKLRAIDQQRLAQDLRERALKLARRAHQRDVSITSRSEYVRYAMTFFPKVAAPRPRQRIKPVTRTAMMATKPAKPAKPAKLFDSGHIEFGARASATFRVNFGDEHIGKGLGGAVFSRIPLRHAAGGHTQDFAHVGAAVSQISITKPGKELKHRFYALELGLARRWWRRNGNHMMLGFAWAPGYYERAAIEESSSMVTAADGQLSVLHARVSLEWHFGEVAIITGLRVLSGPTIWAEPLSIGVNF